MLLATAALPKLLVEADHADVRDILRVLASDSVNPEITSSTRLLVRVAVSGLPADAKAELIADNAVFAFPVELYVQSMCNL